MIKQIQIPQQLKELSGDFYLIKDSKGKVRTKRQEKLYRFYSVILYHNKDELKKNKKRNKPVPDHQIYTYISRSYWRMIDNRYKPYIEFLKNNGFIQAKGRTIDDYKAGIGLYDDSSYIESYTVGSRSKGYRIVGFPDKSDPFVEVNIDYKLDIPSRKNIAFLKSIGVADSSIKRDQYAYRYYHNMSNSYKKNLKGREDLLYYDIKCSVPQQIRLMVQKRLETIGETTDPYIDLFNGDFYENWNRELGLGIIERKKIKEHFSSIVYGGKTEYIIMLRKSIRSKFYVLYTLIKNNIQEKITQNETKFVMDFISELDVDEVLTIHDGFIIFKKHRKVVEQKIEELRLKSGIEFIEKKIGD